MYEGSQIEFGRQANRLTGRLMYCETRKQRDQFGKTEEVFTGFVKILHKGRIYTEIIQTTHLILKSLETHLDGDPVELASQSIDCYGLAETAYARISN